MGDRGVQTVADRAYIPAPIAASQPHLHPSTPHTIGILCLALILVFAASLCAGGNDLRTNLIWGIGSAVFVFLVFAALHFPDGFFVRPSLTFWRVVKGASLLYLILLVFLLSLNVNQVKDVLRSIDPTVLAFGVEKSYASDCRLYDRLADDPWQSLKDKLDMFVFAHLLGWMAKALIIRDWTILWAASLIFEASEIILRHKFPNFFECWWDHLFLDVLGCNILGMWLGTRVCNHFRMKTYKWISDTPSPRHSESWRHAFMPFVWTEYSNISWFASEWRFATLCVIVGFINMFDLNYFVLKAILGLEPNHWICAVRTIITGLAAAPAVSEVHAFISEKGYAAVVSPSSSKMHEGDPRESLGVQAWLLVAILSVELLLIARWAPTSVPLWNIPSQFYAQALLLGIAGLIGFMFVLLRRRRLRGLRLAQKTA